MSLAKLQLRVAGNSVQSWGCPTLKPYWSEVYVVHAFVSIGLFEADGDGVGMLDGCPTGAGSVLSTPPDRWGPASRRTRAAATPTPATRPALRRLCVRRSRSSPAPGSIVVAARRPSAALRALVSRLTA